MPGKSGDKVIRSRKNGTQCSPREDKFAFLVATSAKAMADCYTEAGYAGCKTRAGNSANAANLMTRPKVIERIEHYRKLMREKLDIRTERIMAEICAVALSDPLDVVDVTGGGITVRDLSQIPEHARRAIASIEEVSNKFGDKEIKVRFHSKVPALRLLAEIKQLADSQRGKKAAPRITLDLNRA